MEKSMHSSTRYHISTRPAPAPARGYPAHFHLDDPEAYVKYGHQVFEGSTQRGDDYWSAEIITQTWYQAEHGRIPISGAGYGGKFAGPGFEGLWLDISEIVRPTRDGIHGREYISTQVDLGGGADSLQFDAAGRLLSALPPVVSLPLPVLFNPLPVPMPGRGALRALALAAGRLGTLALLDPADYDEDLASQNGWLAARITNANLAAAPAGWQPRYLELETAKPEELLPLFAQASARWPEAVIAARLPLSAQAAESAVAWVEAGLPVIHLFADEIGQDAEGRSLPEALRAVHLALVEKALRDRVALVASGGIAAAEHVAKAIACAPTVAVDFALQVASGLRPVGR
jgi:hypothetical protein